MLTYSAFNYESNGETLSRNAQAVYIFILISYILFGIDHYLFSLKFLYLNHSNTVWFTILTSAFCHASFAHLTGNMFFIYFFGLLIETELGIKRFVLIYLSSAILVNLTSLLFMPTGTLSVGASGIVFAFFSISIMMKIAWDWKAWIEVLVLVPFVFSYLFTEINSLGKNDNIGHFAHLSGFVFGFVLFKIISRLRP